MDTELAEQTEQGLLPRDKQRKTAFYDYASEKIIHDQEVRQMYQHHHQLDIPPMDGVSPLMRARTMPAGLGADGDILSRTDSLRSRHGGRTGAPTPVTDRTQQDSTHQGTVPQVPQANEALRQGNQTVRDGTRHVQLPQSSIIINEGIHGAGAGVGVGNGPGTFATSDASVTAELSAIYTNIQKVLDIRKKYIELSFQGPRDNPKDDPSWQLYPPPPDPVWDRLKTGGPSNSVSNSGILDRDSVAKGSSDVGMPAKRPRKMGQNIGEDFELDEILSTIPGETGMTFKLDGQGVYQVYEDSESQELGKPIFSIPTIKEFYLDLDTVLNISSDGPSKSFAYRRLQYLEGKFNLYILLNEYQEMADSKKVPHRDFYNVRKVDTHVHHSACMNQKHLLRFIKSKMKKSPDEVVLYRDGRHLTLREVFASINLTAYDLSIDTLDMHAHTDTFHRFDKFNLKYNPVGESRLRTIFLKTDNFIRGRYLAEITKEVISDLEASKYQMAEWRISIYGRSLDEWDKLAAWVVDNKLFSPNIRWLIQIPRLYDVYKSSGLMDNFEQVVVNVFQPLFEVTHNPSSHKKLHIFLQRVIGFDSVDDESKVERRLYRKFPVPKDWDTKQNPPYSYWIYTLFSNIASLNVWRKRRGFNTFLLRPHCGEAGDTDHLAAAVLCCHSISHGLLLRKVPLLQYIFYLEQIGIAMSPLSNNALFLAYERNPFLQYFRRGLNVSLSTDDPLQFAFTKEPLIEEYSVAAQIYKLTAVDMCELAKHSVEQSGFEHVLKQRWLGEYYNATGAAGNDMTKTNVPDIREAFRYETLKQEHDMIARYTHTLPNPTLIDSTLPHHKSGPASPVPSFPTNPSLNPHSFSALPNPLMPTPFDSAEHALPHADGHPSSPDSRPPRSSSMLFIPDSSGPVPQPPGSFAYSPTSMPVVSPVGQTLPRSESSSQIHLDGTEPRIFPGVVSRHRTSSIQQRPTSSSLSEFGGEQVWAKSEVDVAVVEEPEEMEEPEETEKAAGPGKTHLN
ncbi:AMP deaminase [Trichodelitschia bisporula]|uniref:AMP deaminase n=1 Tax=Trichodelitschia bisporula TaxID=703511 RepID=A0A6G1HNJ4_9PEZI|nr:AMP deaminase [Trichodelitschia bisporula]